MTDQRPDTDERDEPGGTPSPGPDNLVSKPATPGTGDAHEATAVPGAYDADEGGDDRGTTVEPGT